MSLQLGLQFPISVHHGPVDNIVICVSERRLASRVLDENEAVLVYSFVRSFEVVFGSLSVPCEREFEVVLGH